MRELEQSAAAEQATTATRVYDWTSNDALFNLPTDTQINGIMTRLRELCATEEGRNAVVKIMRFKTSDADAFKEGRNVVDLHAGDVEPQVMWQLYAYAVQRRALSACVRRVAADDAAAVANYPKGLKPWSGTQPIYFDTARSAPMDQAQLRDRQMAILEQQQQQLCTMAQPGMIMAMPPPTPANATASAPAPVHVPEPTVPSAAEVADKGEMELSHRTQAPVAHRGPLPRGRGFDLDEGEEVNVNALSNTTLWRISGFLDSVERHKPPSRPPSPAASRPRAAQSAHPRWRLVVDSPAGSTAMTPSLARRAPCNRRHRAYLPPRPPPPSSPRPRHRLSSCATAVRPHRRTSRRSSASLTTSLREVRADYMAAAVGARRTPIASRSSTLIPSLSRARSPPSAAGAPRARPAARAGPAATSRRIRLSMARPQPSASSARTAASS